MSLQIDAVRPTVFRHSEVASYSPPVFDPASEDGPVLIVRETRVIGGRPAIVLYSPLGPGHDDLVSILVSVYDPATGARYDLNSSNRKLMGANLEPMIAIAASLFDPPNAP